MSDLCRPIDISRVGNGKEATQGDTVTFSGYFAAFKSRIMKHLTLLSKVAMCVTLLALGLSLPAHAQLTGYTAELDTMFLEMEDDNVLAGIEYYGVYDVYANFTNPEDVAGAVYSDVAALGTPPMGIDAPCGCHNPAVTSIVVDASNNPAFFAAFPD